MLTNRVNIYINIAILQRFTKTIRLQLLTKQKRATSEKTMHQTVVEIHGTM